MHYAFDIGRFIVRPGRALIGLFGRMKLDFSALPILTSFLRDHKILVSQVLSSPIEGCADELMVLVFLDLTDADIHIDELLDEVNKTGYFKVLEIINPITEGFIVDTVSAPIVAGKSRVIMLRDLGYRQLLTEIRKLFGTGGEALLYHVGFNMGLGFAKLHKDLADKVGIKDPAKIYQQISCMMFQWAGFGRKEALEISSKHAIIHVYDSFECENGRPSIRPYSQLVRGLVAGTLAELFNRSFNVTEDLCIAKGDPFCRFRVVSR
ncbi:MAG: V4R domain-containing protein [Candidatus Methanomethyliaceae archaeon]